MFKKTMKFDDLDGNEVSQTFYFNYNKKEVAELLEFGAIQEFAKAGETHLPLEEKLARLSTPVEESGLSQTENNRQAYGIFQDLILDAYGVKGEDNVSFEKNDKNRNYFRSHVAFPEMIFEFLENPKLAAEFVESCLPPRMVEKAKAEMQKENSNKLTSANLSEMVDEAARRQKDPATRIEPGPEAAAAVLGENAEVAQAARSIAENSGGVKAKAQEDMTEEDILGMDDLAFRKLDPRKFSQEQLMWAFKRKTQN